MLHIRCPSFAYANLQIDCLNTTEIALWATANAASQGEIAKEAYKGNPKGAAAAEREAMLALSVMRKSSMLKKTVINSFVVFRYHFLKVANTRADRSRVAATVASFVNVCIAQVGTPLKIMLCIHFFK